MDYTAIIVSTISAIPGIISLVWLAKAKKTSIGINTFRSSYETVQDQTYFSVELIISNYSERNLAITDAILRLAYDQGACHVVNVNKDKTVFSERPINFSENLPIEVNPNSSRKVKLIFTFKDIVLFALARMQTFTFLGWIEGKIPFAIGKEILPVNKEEWEKLPILGEITIANSEGKLFTQELDIYDGTYFISPSGNINVVKEAELNKKFLERILKMGQEKLKRVSF
jgi:hypothetical protein